MHSKCFCLLIFNLASACLVCGCANQKYTDVYQQKDESTEKELENDSELFSLRKYHQEKVDKDLEFKDKIYNFVKESKEK